MTGTKKPALLCEKSKIRARQTEAPTPLAEACHMRFPKTGRPIEDGDGLEQTIAKLKGTFLETAAVCLDTIDEHVMLHVSADPVSSGIQSSVVETTECKRAVGSTKPKRIGKRDVDLRFTRGVWHVIQVTLFIRIVEVDGRRHHLVT